MAKKAETKKVFIINGKEYPCMRTLAASFYFKDITSKEVTQIDAESITEMATYMWATIKGACERLGVAFPFEAPRDLALYIDETDILAWSELVMDDGADKKKQ